MFSFSTSSIHIFKNPVEEFQERQLGNVQDYYHHQSQLIFERFHNYWQNLGFVQQRGILNNLKWLDLYWGMIKSRQPCT